MNPTDPLARAISRIETWALGIGAVFLLATFAGAYLDPRQFYRSYLMGYLLWLGIALGSLGWVALSHLTGGQWAVVSRRTMEAAFRTLPLTTLLFVPVLAGMGTLYLWTNPRAVAADHLLQEKQAYLNVPFFIVRTVIYFGCWLLLAHFMNKWSLERDETGDAALTRKLKALSSGVLVLYVMTATFASIDWVGSIEPQWYSSIYGALFVTGQALSALSFTIIVLSVLSHYTPLSDVISAKQFHDLGNLLLAFVMLWAYMAFSQLLIIWSGNLQVEITYYVNRTQAGWGAIALALIVLHFAVPFVLLLSREMKRKPEYLAKIAAGILVLRVVDYFWVVEPPFEPAGPRLHWLDITAPIGIGGVWFGFYLWQLKRAPLLPREDPEFETLLGHPEEA